MAPKGEFLKIRKKRHQRHQRQSEPDRSRERLSCLDAFFRRLLRWLDAPLYSEALDWHVWFLHKPITPAGLSSGSPKQRAVAAHGRWDALNSSLRAALLEATRCDRMHYEGATYALSNWLQRWPANLKAKPCGRWLESSQWYDSISPQ